jgi:hypothetical protein
MLVNTAASNHQGMADFMCWNRSACKHPLIVSGDIMMGAACRCSCITMQPFLFLLSTLAWVGASPWQGQSLLPIMAAAVQTSSSRVKLSSSPYVCNNGTI